MEQDQLERLLSHREWMRVLSYHLASDSDAAGELFQDTWVSLLRRPPDNRRCVRPWVYTVMANLARNRHRGQQRRARREQEYASRRPDEPEVHQQLEEAEAVASLRRSLAAIREPARDMLDLRYFCQQSTKQIAESQGISEPAVRARVKRALQALRAEMDKTYGGDRSAWSLVLLGWARSSGSVPVAPPAPVGEVTSSLLPRLWQGLVGWSWLSVTATLVTLALASLVVDFDGDLPTADEPLPGSRSFATLGLSTTRAPTITPVVDHGAAAPLAIPAMEGLFPTPAVEEEVAAEGPPFIIHALDSRTGEVLDIAHVQSPANGSQCRFHPCQITGGLLLQDQPTPVQIPRLMLEARELGRTGTAVLFIGSNGYAWQKLSVDLDTEEAHYVSLEPSARLSVEMNRPGQVDTLFIQMIDEKDADRVYFIDAVLPDTDLFLSDWEGLHPGRYRLQVVCTHRPPKVLIEAAIELVAGQHLSVPLDLQQQDDLPELVTIGGSLVLPRIAGDVVPSIELTAVSGTAIHVRRARRVALQAEVRVEHWKGTSYLWTAPDARPGDYQAVIRPFGVVRRITVPASGSADIALSIPELSRVDVNVVDAINGQAVAVESIAWRQPGTAPNGLALAAMRVPRGEWPGEFSLLCPPGRLNIVCSKFDPFGERDQTWLGEFKHTAAPGKSHATLAVRKPARVQVRLIEQDLLQVFDPRLHHFSVERLDGEPFIQVGSISRTGGVRISPPGVYRFSLDPGAGYEPCLRVQIELKDAGATKLDYQLTHQP